MGWPSGHASCKKPPAGLSASQMAGFGQRMVGTESMPTLYPILPVCQGLFVKNFCPPSFWVAVGWCIWYSLGVGKADGPAKQPRRCGGYSRSSSRRWDWPGIRCQ
jgi:hypothetical protein